MFRQRLITTLVLIPLALAAIYFAHPWLLAVGLVGFVMLAGWEWTQLIPIVSNVKKWHFMLLLLGVLALAGYGFLPVLLMVGLILWMFILFAIVTFPTSQTIWGNRVVVAGMCLWLLSLFTWAFVAIYQQVQGQDWIVYLFCLVWATDVGAYLTGKYIGKHKLIPAVSPGKTIEGMCGGILFALLVAYVAAIYFHPLSWGPWYGIALATTLLSMVGDLFISMLKRRCQLKDTGRIFPGHGGILDRVDSLIAATPVFYIGLFY